MTTSMEADSYLERDRGSKEKYEPELIKLSVARQATGNFVSRSSEVLGTSVSSPELWGAESFGYRDEPAGPSSPRPGVFILST